jgi:hypothetical protein
LGSFSHKQTTGKIQVIDFDNYNLSDFLLPASASFQTTGSGEFFRRFPHINAISGSKKYHPNCKFVKELPLVNSLPVD